MNTLNPNHRLSDEWPVMNVTMITEELSCVCQNNFSFTDQLDCNHLNWFGFEHWEHRGSISAEDQRRQRWGQLKLRGVRGECDGTNGWGRSGTIQEEVPKTDGRAAVSVLHKTAARYLWWRWMCAHIASCYLFLPSIILLVLYLWIFYF